MSKYDTLKPRSVWSIFAELSKVPRGSGNEAAVMAMLKDWADARGLTQVIPSTGEYIAGRLPEPEMVWLEIADMLGLDPGIAGQDIEDYLRSAEKIEVMHNEDDIILAPGESKTCYFENPVNGVAGDVVPDTITVAGRDDEGRGVQDSDTAQVEIIAPADPSDPPKMVDAGRLTGDYLLRHRIPGAAQAVLKRLPRRYASRLLLRAIADLDPHDGEVRLDGEAAGSIKPHRWRSRVGLLPPESHWWLPTPGAHFSGGAPVSPVELGLPGDIMEQPVERLSSGEKQRLALLRMLSNRPQVLLLDEPTANLDPANTRLVEAVITRYRDSRSAAVIWVSHDQEQVERVGCRSLRLDGGRLREAQGTS